MLLTYLLVAAAASLVGAEADPLPQPEMEAFLQPRKTEEANHCTSDVLSLIHSLATPPPKIVRAVHGQDPCHATVPHGLSSEWSSYSSHLSSWFSGHSSDVSSVLSNCPELSHETSRLPVCVSSFIGTGTPTTNTAAATAATGTHATHTKNHSGGGSVAHESGKAYAALVVAAMAAAAL